MCASNTTKQNVKPQMVFNVEEDPIIQLSDNECFPQPSSVQPV